HFTRYLKYHAVTPLTEFSSLDSAPHLAGLFLSVIPGTKGALCPRPACWLRWSPIEMWPYGFREKITIPSNKVQCALKLCKRGVRRLAERLQRRATFAAPRQGGFRARDGEKLG